MKKIFTALTIVAVLVALTVFAACTPDVTNKFETIDSAEEFYAYGVASIGTLLSSNGAESSTLQTVALSQTDGNDCDRPQDGTGNQYGSGQQEQQSQGLTDNVTEEQINEVNEYIALVEGLLSNGTITSQVTQSDMEGYAYKNVVSIKDFNGETISYTMYYNTVEVADKDDHDDKFELDDEQEQTFRIEGVMVVGQESYAVQGYEKSESEQDESETESVFRVELGNDSFIVLNREQESETEHGVTETEDKFVYSFYQQGRLVERTEVEYEQEEDETELVMTVTSNGTTDVLRFEEELNYNGEKCIRVYADIDGQQISFRVFVTVDEQGQPVYRYVYGNGSCDHHRYGK